MLADFGLAKFLSTAPISTSFRTSTGPGPGTQWFTAPEQYRRFLDADERADIYSLGVLIWELYSAFTPPLDRHDTGLSRRLQPMVLKATERNPADRFASVTELRAAFCDAVEGLPK